ncbi:outer membrane receptor protein [Flavobacterium enshiense DK69]|uniref:TonB-dependent receptor n=1 Tax=Flavobacterium enshiense DK69 TaxID=1107311 RepID=V6S7D8_9FLAO|nr:TonB-dependent receptor [Flavobacterium enshiense]ESU22324.1 outer membrane receptor protein [Flavobacterium enshiense DK69]KGO97328.1 TonB-dependent receptor [Flavobacterium enshiense DK69]
MKKILFAVLVLGQILYGQNPVNKDSLNAKQLDNVVITANRGASLKREVPVAISKVTQKTINETKATAVYEIVNKVPGVLMVNLGNEQHSMAIRQPMTTNPYYLYLEDGLSIRPMGVFNHNALLEINQFNLQNIEVVRGPVSSLYGPEAVGGAVNLISLKPSLQPEMKVGIQADQWGYIRLQAAAGATVGKVGVYVAGLTSAQRDSWMTYSDYNKDNINARIDYNINKSTRLIWTLFSGRYYSDMSSPLNEADFYNRTYKSTTDFTYRKSDALRSKVTFEKEWNPNAQSSLTVFTRDNELGQSPAYTGGIKWTPGQTTAKGEINSNNFKSYGVLAQHNQKFDFLDGSLVAGGLYDNSPVDYNAHQLDLKANLNPGGQTVSSYEIIAERPDIKLADYNARIYNTAGFAQLTFRPVSNLIITGGARYDNMSFDYNNNIDHSTGSKVYDQFTFKGGVNYNPFSCAGFYANYSQGFAPPGLTSIFRAKPGTGGSTGTPAEFYYNLKPAEFDNYEVGGWIGCLEKKMNIEYSVYYMEGKNELLNVRLPDNSTDYRSVGETLHKGVELAVNYIPNSQFKIRAGGTYAIHEFVDFKLSDKPTDPIQNLDGKEMPSAPHWVANSEVTYYPKWLPNLRAGVEWQLVSSWYQDQINTVKYDGYNVFNGRIGYQYKGFEFYTNVMNFTDKLYAYNVTRGNTPTSTPSYSPAAPRTFVFGLQYHLQLNKKKNDEK